MVLCPHSIDHTYTRRKKVTGSDIGLLWTIHVPLLGRTESIVWPKLAVVVNPLSRKIKLSTLCVSGKSSCVTVQLVRLDH